MADLSIILNLSQQIPAARRVQSATVRAQLALPPLIAGSTYEAELYLVDGDGAYDPRSGTAGNGPRLLITYVDAAGDVVELVRVSAGSFAPITNGWSFKLPLTTQELLDYLGETGAPRAATFEVNLTNPADEVVPLYLCQCWLTPRSYDPAVPDPSPSAAVPYLNVRPDITGLGITAAGSTKLSGISAATLLAWTDGIVVRLQLTGDIVADYRLVTGAVGTESQFKVACDNAAGRYWQLASNPVKQGASTVWDSDLSKFKQILEASNALGIADDADAFVIPD